MYTIHKYPLEIERQFTIQIPSNSQPLHVEEQNGIPTIWCLIDPHMPIIESIFYCLATGETFPSHFSDTSGVIRHAFIGTVLMSNGDVWHYWRSPYENPR